MSLPTTSVIVPTLNRRDDLLAFTKTLIEQTVLPDEFVIVDAGNIENLDKEILNALKGSGIRLQYARSEAGTSLQRNVAMDLANGEIFFITTYDLSSTSRTHL